MPEKKEDWTKGLRICAGIALGLVALQRLVESLEEEPVCKYIYIPDDVCEVTFAKPPKCKRLPKSDHSEFASFKTSRDEDIIFHFRKGKLVSIELLSDKKPCQTTFKEVKK
jgi:hypothetical protein